MTSNKIPLHGRNHLPGGSDPIPRLDVGDAYPANEDAGVLFTISDGYSSHWDVLGTVDNLCLYNGYLPSDGTQHAFTTWRFMLGPFGSIHEWSLLFRTDSDHGILTGSLASIPEDDPASGYDDPTGILQDISTLDYIPFELEIQGYSASLARNDQSYWPTHPIRVMGQPGAPFTTATFDAGSGTYFIDGGPGPYALKLAVDTKGVSPLSSGYQFDLQALHHKRMDWAFG